MPSVLLPAWETARTRGWKRASPTSQVCPAGTPEHAAWSLAHQLPAGGEGRAPPFLWVLTRHKRLRENLI